MDGNVSLDNEKVKVRLTRMIWAECPTLLSLLYYVISELDPAQLLSKSDYQSHGAVYLSVTSSHTSNRDTVSLPRVRNFGTLPRPPNTPLGGCERGLHSYT